jgi:hypothetical protein
MPHFICQMSWNLDSSLILMKGMTDITDLAEA